MNVFAAYRRVLSNGNLSRLMFGEFVSSIGDWLYLVALLIVIYERASDPIVLGLVGAARVLPYIVLSIPAGIAADRYDRRLILLVTDLARGVIMLLMALVVIVNGPVEAIVILAIVATCFSSFFSPAIGSYIPSLVRDESELGPANSTWSTLDNVAFIIGPAIAGILISFGGLTAAFLLNAISFVVVAAVLWRLPRSRAGGGKASAVDDSGDPSATPASAPPTVPVRELLSPVMRPLVGLNILGATGSFVGGGLGVLTVVIAVDTLKAGDAGTGLLNAAVGVGGLVGAFISTALVLGRRLSPPMVLGGVLLAVSVVVLGQTELIGVAMLALAVGAAGGLLIEVVSTTLFQRIVPDAIRGRTLGAMETFAVAAYAAGSFVLPVLSAPNALGISGVLLLSGILTAISLVVAVPLIGRHGTLAVAEDAMREKLLGVDMFAGLPPARLESAMRHAEVRKMARGDQIVREGEPADHFYVIAEGKVEVTQVAPAGGPDRVLRTMGPGEFFGEIGLLSTGTRTATVTAVEPGTLLSLARPEFLELVGSGPGLTSSLLDLHRGATTPAASAGG